KGARTISTQTLAKVSDLAPNSPPCRAFLVHSFRQREPRCSSRFPLSPPACHTPLVTRHSSHAASSTTIHLHSEASRCTPSPKSSPPNSSERSRWFSSAQDRSVRINFCTVPDHLGSSVSLSPMVLRLPSWSLRLVTFPAATSTRRSPSASGLPSGSAPWTSFSTGPLNWPARSLPHFS